VEGFQQIWAWVRIRLYNESVIGAYRASIGGALVGSTCAVGGAGVRWVESNCVGLWCVLDDLGLRRRRFLWCGGFVVCNCVDEGTRELMVYWSGFTCLLRGLYLVLRVGGLLGGCVGEVCYGLIEWEGEPVPGVFEWQDRCDGVE